VVQIHAWTQTDTERKDVGDLSDSDRRAQPLRYLITVDRRDLSRIQHRLDANLASRTAQQLHELVEGQRAAVLGADDRLTCTQGGLGEVEMKYHPRPCRLRIKGRPRFH
jgi:hypothetical protein